jgi:hypothetical protein
MNVIAGPVYVAEVILAPFINLNVYINVGFIKINNGIRNDFCIAIP